MIEVLSRYFSFMLVIALILPLWVSVFASAPLNWEDIQDRILISIAFGTLVWLVKTRPGFHVRGNWRRPDKGELKAFNVCALSVVIIDYGSKLLFFRKDQAESIEIFLNFGLLSVFNESKFELSHLYFLFWVILLFFLGALFFRFSVKLLDRIWLISAACALGATVAISLERIFFGGVHDLFYLSGSLRWLCPNCALKFPSGYVWTPSDFFLNAAVVPILVFVVSYFWPVRGKRSD